MKPRSFAGGLHQYNVSIRVKDHAGVIQTQAYLSGDVILAMSSPK